MTRTALPDFVRSRLQELKWTQTKLAEVSGVSEGSISNMLRGKSIPETYTIERIADALGVPRQKILGLLAEEGRGEVGQAEIDPSALYIARQLTGLPPDLKEPAIDAVSGVVDSFRSIAEQREGYSVREAKEALSPYQRAANTLREIKSTDPELYEELMQETEARSK